MNIKIGILICLGLCVAGHAHAKTAVAEMKGVGTAPKLKGKITFTEEKGGVVILGELSKAPKGKHGIHLHTKASCDDPGGHLNPSGNPHGYAPKDYPLKSHPGDMGNIEVDEDGNATYKVHMPELGIAAGSRYDIRNRAVVITQNEDDFSQPEGKGGPAIACGTIMEA